MTPLRRIAWNGLAAVSALLCVATCVVGMRSYWYFSVWDSYRSWIADGRGHRDTAFVESWRGGLCYDHNVLMADSPAGYSLVQYGRFRDVRGEKFTGPSSYAGFLRKTYGGFGAQHVNSVYDGRPKTTESDWRIALPYWFMAALFALPPTAWWLAFRRARLAAWRLRHLRCFHCGFDLRATPDRCPECGAPVTSKG